MSHPIDLPDQLYEAIQQAAATSGTTPEEWLVTHLPIVLPLQQPPSRSAAVSNSLADLFEGRVGLIHSGGGLSLSEECGSTFTDYLVAKRREEQV